MPRPSDVDVGCFQVSLRYHPAAFATMADALDPVANARYAARFLLELRDKYGDWDHAVGAYHSATEPLGADYRGRVMAQWKGAPPAAAAVGPPVEQPRWKVISIAAALPPPLGPASASAGDHAGRLKWMAARTVAKRLRAVGGVHRQPVARAGVDFRRLAQD